MWESLASTGSSVPFHPQTHPLSRLPPPLSSPPALPALPSSTTHPTPFPCLADGKPISIWESANIDLYLAEKYDKFIPKDPRAKNEMMTWIFWQVCERGASHLPMLNTMGSVSQPCSGHYIDVPAIVAGSCCAHMCWPWPRIKCPAYCLKRRSTSPPCRLVSPV